MSSGQPGATSSPAIMDAIAQQIESGHHPGDASTLTSAAAGMQHVIHAADARGIDTTVLGAALRIVERAIDAGHGSDGFSRLAVALQPRHAETLTEGHNGDTT